MLYYYYYSAETNKMNQGCIMPRSLDGAVSQSGQSLVEHQTLTVDKTITV